MACGQPMRDPLVHEPDVAVQRDVHAVGGGVADDHRQLRRRFQPFRRVDVVRADGFPSPTSTVVACSPDPAGAGQQTTCTATVTDTAATSLTPSGTVSFSSSGAGSFTSSECTLSGSGASASCAVSYTQAASGQSSITAGYGGDNAHAASSGASALSVTALAAPRRPCGRRRGR